MFFAVTETQEKAECFTYCLPLSQCAKQGLAKMWYFDTACFGCCTGLLTLSGLVQIGAKHLYFLPESTLQVGLRMRVRKLSLSSKQLQKRETEKEEQSLNFKVNAFTLPRELVKWLLCYFLSQVSDPMVEIIFLICKDIFATVYTLVTIMVDAIRDQMGTQ